MLAYHADTGSLTVQLEPTVPQLTPLLVSNPGDSFDPADPWYDSLDPSRRGLSFSRRYGFVMDTMSDPLPAGTAIWIRNLSSSAGLEVFRYRGMAPKMWKPIFGTAGTTNALMWDGTMFHPAFTALPGMNEHTAVFEAFLVNTSSGEALAGANTGPFTFHWTNIPDGRPALALEHKVAVSWPSTATNYVLEAAADLASANWQLVTNTPVRIGDQYTVLVDPSEASRFFRLRSGP
jgi:hypothetical protein